MPSCVLIGPRASGKTTFLGSLINSDADIHSTQSVDDIYIDNWLVRDLPGFNTEILLDTDLVILFVCCFGNVRMCYESVRNKYSGNLCLVLTHADNISVAKLPLAFSKATSSVSFFDTTSIFLCNCLSRKDVKTIWRLCIN